MDFSGDDCTDLALASIEINPGDQSINVGESVTFTAKGFSSCQEVAITPSWSNNAPNGVFTATTVGTYTVTATVGEISQSVNVTVSDEEPFSVKIEAEDYVAMSGIQTETCSEGGLNVGYIDAGDWMDYANIDIPRAGTYLVEYRVASWADGAKIRLEQDAGTTFRGEIDVPNTYGWQNWITISHTVTLEAGVQHLAIYAPAGGFNVNWLQISSTSLKKATLNVTQDLQTQIKLYPNPANNHVIVDLSGNDELLPIRVIDFSGKQVMLIEASYSKTRIDITDLQPGIYLVNVGNTTQRLIKQ
jgi:hypothetical protein